MELSINKTVKDHLISCLHKWYAAGIQKKILTGDDDKWVIDLRLSLLKPPGFQWLDSAFSCIHSSDFVYKGFHVVGITEILSDIL